jgi:hypothetical protein
VVAQTEAVELPPVVADLHGAGRLHQLLVVATGELLAGPLERLVGLATEHGGTAPVDEVHGTRRVGIGQERLARVGHLQGVVQEHGVALVRDA